tara:strand:- start:563 stop:1129 length:567 start_codon:yes stop_codon:yes gene_type:complete
LADKVNKLTRLVKQLERPYTRNTEMPIQNFELRIAADGIWYYRETPINRIALVQLFAKVLQKDSDGKYWLITPMERGLIEVDDAPFLAVDVNQVGGQEHQDISLVFRTNLDEEIVCGPENPLRVEIEPETQEPSPYILVRDKLEARITRSVFYQLVELSSERIIKGKRILGVWSEATFFPLGPIDMDS